MIELMVVVAIVAILAALAAPNFTPMIERYRVRQSLEEISSTLYFARSEAIKRGGGIIILKAPNSGTCNLAGSNAQWGCGWRVFADTDGSGVQNGSEPTLQTSPEPANTNIVLTGNLGRITIDRWGTFTGAPATGILLYPGAKAPSDPSAAILCVSPSGRIRSIPGSGTC